MVEAWLSPCSYPNTLLHPNPTITAPGQLSVCVYTLATFALDHSHRRLCSFSLPLRSPYLSEVGREYFLTSFAS